MAKKKPLTIPQKYKKIFNMVRRHGEIEIVLCTNNKDVNRRRTLHSDGSCEVAYKRAYGDEWTDYDVCCFMSDQSEPKNLEQTMKLMRDHDRTWLKPSEIMVKGKVKKL
jgi:hypothetical protein